MMANIEIKPTTDTGPLTGKMVALAARELWTGMTPPLLSSFEIDALEAAQQAAPELPRGLLLDEWRDDWRELTARLGCVSIHLNYKLLDKARVMQLKDAGLRILVYTVNKPQRAAELLRWGVDCICTDAIDVIGRTLRPNSFQRNVRLRRAGLIQHVAVSPLRQHMLLIQRTIRITVAV